MVDTENTFHRFIFILIDGAPYELFKDLLEHGTLPHIEKHVIARGSLKKVVSAFPTTTGPASVPFFMGLFPGRANITGNRWLSKLEYEKPYGFGHPGIRNYVGLEGLKMDIDLPAGPTLFDFFNPVSNVYNPLVRGCPTSKNKTRWLKPFSLAYSVLTRDYRYYDQIAAHQLLKSVEAGDQFVMCVFPTVDTLSHVKGITAPSIIESYKVIDHTIGKLCALLQRTNDFEKTLLVITSDHGMTDTHTSVDIPRYLNDSGWRCLKYFHLWQRPPTCASMVSGNAMTHIYFKNDTVSGSEPANGQGWGQRMFFEQLKQIGVIDGLLELEGISVIAGQNEDGSITIENRHGTGKITCRNGRNAAGDLPVFSYQFDPADPLGYGTNYTNLSSREVLCRTYHSDYPDAIPQLWSLFESNRTGDLILSAEKGYDLHGPYRFRAHQASHGALLAEHMYIPLAVNVPIAEEFIRSVDIFPTVLSLCGHTVDAQHIDGKIVT